MDVANHSLLLKLFTAAHALGKNRQPFVWLCDVVCKMGLDVGQSYRSDQQCREFSHYIAEVERQKLIKLFKESPFVSLVVDGSTDSSVTEQELLYLCSANNGDLTSFLSICAMEKPLR